MAVILGGTILAIIITACLDCCWTGKWIDGKYVCLELFFNETEISLDMNGVCQTYVNHHLDIQNVTQTANKCKKKRFSDTYVKIKQIF